MTLSSRMKKLVSILRVFPDIIGLTRMSKYLALADADALMNADVYDLANKILNKFHNGGGLRPPLQKYKLAELYRLLRQYKPNEIVELGSGSSTAIVAEYCHNTKIQAISIDENTVWIENTLKIITDLGYDESVRLTQKTASLSDDKLAARYNHLNIASCDLLIVDGPSLVQEGVNHKHAVCLDASEINARVILVDMRKETTLFLAKLFKFRYNVIYSDILFRLDPVNRPLRYWSVLERITN